MGVTMIIRGMISDVMIMIVVTIRIIDSSVTTMMGVNNDKSGVSYVMKRATRSGLVCIMLLPRRRRTKGSNP